jgi:hypothetical protein
MCYDNSDSKQYNNYSYSDLGPKYLKSEYEYNMKKLRDTEKIMKDLRSSISSLTDNLFFYEGEKYSCVEKIEFLETLIRENEERETQENNEKI